VGPGESAAITLVEARQAPLLARPYYAAGDPGPIVAALAQVPEMLAVTMPFLGAVLGPSALPARTKELVILRTSSRTGCRYCVENHTVAARDVGLSIAEVRSLRGEMDVEAAFPDEADRAVLDWCDAIVGTGAVDPAPRVRLLSCFAEHEVVELTLLAASTLLLNRFCTALELPTSSSVLARLAADGLG
jgi:AhpD family alkylhydroperoxidase